MQTMHVVWPQAALFAHFLVPLLWDAQGITDGTTGGTRALTGQHHVLMIQRTCRAVAKAFLEHCLKCVPDDGVPGTTKQDIELALASFEALELAEDATGSYGSWICYMVVQPECVDQRGHGMMLRYTKQARVVGVVCSVVLPMKRKLLKLANGFTSMSKVCMLGPLFVMQPFRNMMAAWHMMANLKKLCLAQQCIYIEPTVQTSNAIASGVYGYLKKLSFPVEGDHLLRAPLELTDAVICSSTYRSPRSMTRTVTAIMQHQYRTQFVKQVPPNFSTPSTFEVSQVRCGALGSVLSAASKPPGWWWSSTRGH